MTKPDIVLRKEKPRFTATALIVGVSIAVFACASQPENHATTSSPTATPGVFRKIVTRAQLAAQEQTIHAHINKERSRRGLPTMRWDDALARVAVKHSADMSSRMYFSHVSPEGQGFSERYFKSNYACGITVDGVLHRGAENIFRLSLAPQNSLYGFQRNRDARVRKETAESIIGGWMNSEEDRNNLLSPHWQRHGIGIKVSPDGATMYITINFC